MAVIEHRRVISHPGTAESDWHSWLHSGSIGSCTLADLLTCTVRLVVVAPHPDDEVLACGGLMAMHQAQSGEVVVVSVSDGEASHGACSQRQALALATTRHNELLAGLYQLGLEIVEVIRLALPDGAIAAHSESLEAMLAGLLRPTDVAVTTFSLDGHPDHEATARATARACMKLGCRLIEAPVWMWHWASINDPVVPWHRLHRLQLAPHVVASKRAALAAHVSQLEVLSRADGAVLDTAIMARASRAEEYFFYSSS